jgi:hypothetical protein
MPYGQTFDRAIERPLAHDVSSRCKTNYTPARRFSRPLNLKPRGQALLSSLARNERTRLPSESSKNLFQQRRHLGGRVLPDLLFRLVQNQGKAVE